MAAKASPPAAVVGANLLGYSVADWIQWITLLYVILLAGQKIWELVRMSRASVPGEEIVLHVDRRRNYLQRVMFAIMGWRK